MSDVMHVISADQTEQWEKAKVQVTTEYFYEHCK